MISNCVTTEYTADPKVRSPYCFRTADSSLFDAISFGEYAAKVSKELGLNRWYTIAADYVFGRDSARSWMEQLMKRNPQVQIVGQGWPKLFEPDYTPYITQVANTKPDAAICITFAGDTVSFVRQGLMYGIFEKTRFFFLDLGNYMIIDPIVEAQGKFVGAPTPASVTSGSFPTRRPTTISSTTIRNVSASFRMSMYGGCIQRCFCLKRR